MEKLEIHSISGSLCLPLPFPPICPLPPFAFMGLFLLLLFVLSNLFHLANKVGLLPVNLSALRLSPERPQHRHLRGAARARLSYLPRPWTT